MQLRFHSPYRHWFKGFFVEMLVIVTFVLVVAGLSVAAALVFG